MELLKKCSGKPKKGTIAMLFLWLTLQSILKSAVLLDDDLICKESSFRRLNSLMLLPLNSNNDNVVYLYMVTPGLGNMTTGIVNLGTTIPEQQGFLRFSQSN